MTRSPFTVTLMTLLPLAGLGWPLARVINQKAYVPPEIEEVNTGPLVTADLMVRSAHPFASIQVTIGEASWTFAPNEDIKEIHYPRDARLILTVTVKWPQDTPETAVLLTLQPEGQGDLTHTLWGFDEVTAEIEFTPDPKA